MIVKHNKTGNLYQLIDDECKAKINGEWIDAVLYRGWEKNTGEYYHFVREKSDFDSHLCHLHKVSFYYMSTLRTRVRGSHPGKVLHIRHIRHHFSHLL